MALVGWLFFRVFFAGWVDAQSAQEYIAGMILLGVAPCTAIVFVWSQLAKGDPNYTLVQVSVSDLIMIVAYAPIAGVLLGVSDIEIPWNTLILSTILYVLLPLLAGWFTRSYLQKSGKSVAQFSGSLKPFSVMGLILTVVLLFAFQAQTIMANTLSAEDAETMMQREEFKAAQALTARQATPKDVANGVKVGEAF
ncbi:bile acid:sodium symporter [Avibacterium paragallinarum]